MGKNRHVVPHNGGWAMRKPRRERISSAHRTQQAAINQTAKRARADKSEVVIHGRDGGRSLGGMLAGKLSRVLR